MARREDDARKPELMPMARQQSLLKGDANKKNEGATEQTWGSFSIRSKWLVMLVNFALTTLRRSPSSIHLQAVPAPAHVHPAETYR